MILVNLAGAAVIAAVVGLLFVWHYAGARGWLRASASRTFFRLWFSLSMVSAIPALILCFGEVFALRVYPDGPPLDVANPAELKVEVVKILGMLFGDVTFTITPSLVSTIVGIAIAVPGIGVVAGILARRQAERVKRS